LLNQLEEKTIQSDKIARAIKNGDIKVNILGDELFDRALGSDIAYQRGNNIYLRSSRATDIFSDAVHEGTHALDFINKFGYDGAKSQWQWEKRAYYYERQFQIVTNGKTEFKTLNDMLFHIWSNYSYEIYNPYKMWGEP
jgi:hypothetical protein